MQSYFRVSLLLQVADDWLAHKFAGSHHMQHFVVSSVDQSQLEFELSGVNGENSRSEFTVQTEHIITLDAGKIYR